MKYLLLSGCLLGLAACANRPHVDGWAEKEANQWATKMGNDHANITCQSYYFMLDHGDDNAYCSVNMGDRIYPLSCWVEYDDSNTLIRRVCVQEAR